MSTNSIDSKLDALAGLESAKKAVRRLAATGDIARAVLLYGPDGVGKGSLALILAQCWMCREPHEGMACGQCPSCISFENELNPDIFALEPGGRGEMIGVAAISDGRGDPKKDPYSVQRFLRTLPIHSRCKVVLIEGAHRMHHASANAILKTLEEPEAYARFILTTARPSAMTPTIRSRCLGIACGADHDRGEDGLRLTPGTRNKYVDRDTLLVEFAQLAIQCCNAAGPFRFAERFRDLVEEAKDDEEGAARKRHLEAISLFAEALASQGHHAAAALATDAHRRIRQNGQFGIVTDALFAKIGTQC